MLVQGEECPNHIAERSRSEITAKQKLDKSGVRREKAGPRRHSGKCRH